MSGLIRRCARYPVLPVASALLWGVLEFVALQRSRHRSRQPRA
ncbi:hypothetical protein [Parazoarcus communis]|nr:hypothetical protein [Parazoarcus communis]